MMRWADYSGFSVKQEGLFVDGCDKMMGGVMNQRG